MVVENIQRRIDEGEPPLVAAERGAKQVFFAVVATTAKNTCLAPRSAATSGGSPSSMRRWMFSTTTMASSTTRPMASTRASRVKRLIENPIGASTMKVDRMQIGATIEGIKAERQLPRKTKFTIATRASDRPMVIQTSWIASRVNMVQSTATLSTVPLGRVGLI